MNGNIGRDFISGGFDNDVLTGNAGNDRVFANQGVDQVIGGEGNDDLWALSRKDVVAQGDAAGDSLSGGDGRDRFHTFDGEVDTVDCGAGEDRAILDIYDVIADATPENPNGSCEKVTRTVAESDEEENKTESPDEDELEKG